MVPGWESPLFRSRGIAHWFSSRDVPPCESIARHLGGPGAVAVRARQVHGRRCIVATKQAAACLQEADAVLSSDPLLVPMVSTADCVPLLIVCTATRTCAAVHAGWRGIALNIVHEAIASMRMHFLADPSSIVVAIGPCAGGDRYEVGEDVCDAWGAIGLGAAIRAPHAPGKSLVNCALAVRLLLEREGISTRAIDMTAPCTIDDERFESYRREPQSPIRMIAGIVPPA